MNRQDIEHMKAVPGLHKVRMAGTDGYLIVASVDGQLYGVVPDNRLSDDGWSDRAVWSGCLLSGGVFTKQQIDDINRGDAGPFNSRDPKTLSKSVAPTNSGGT